LLKSPAIFLIVFSILSGRLLAIFLIGLAKPVAAIPATATFPV